MGISETGRLENAYLFQYHSKKYNERQTSGQVSEVVAPKSSPKLGSKETTLLVIEEIK